MLEVYIPFPAFSNNSTLAWHNREGNDPDVSTNPKPHPDVTISASSDLGQAPAGHYIIYFKL